MTLAHHAIPTRATLVGYVRDEVSDPSTLPTGQVLADGALKFSAAVVNRAIEQAVMRLETTMAILTPGASLRVVEMTYTEDAEYACALPSAVVDIGGVYKVEQVSDGANPVAMRQVSALDVEEYTSNPAYSTRPLVYAFLAGAPSGATGHPSWKIQVRPRRLDSQSLRLYYVATPVVPGADTDAVGVAGRWLELVSLETALILLSRQDEFTLQQELRRQEALQNFRNLSGVYAGRHYVRRSR